MHVEIRKRGSRKLYYLAHSFRDNGKVRKVRRYLGANLAEKKVEKLRKEAGNAIREQIDAYRKIRDPLHTALSAKELEMIQTLLAKGEIPIQHLSEEDWLRFTEAFTYDIDLSDN